MASKIKGLQQWCRRMTDGYPHVDVANFTTSWRDGMAFCAIIHRFRPDLIDYESLAPENVFENNKLAFEVAERELDIPAFLEAEDMARLKVPDKLSVITYVSQYYNFLNALPQLGGPSVKGKVSTKTSTGTKRHTDTDTSQAPSVKKAVTSSASKENTKPHSEAKIHSHGDKCNICQNKVYLLERHIEGGKLYHRSCFRHSELSPTNKVYNRSPFMSPSLSSEGPKSPTGGKFFGRTDHSSLNPTNTIMVGEDGSSHAGVGSKHTLTEPDREDSKKSKLQTSKVHKDKYESKAPRHSESKDSSLQLPLSGKEAKKLEKRHQEIIGAEKTVSQTPTKRNVPLIFQQKDKKDETSISSVSEEKVLSGSTNKTVDSKSSEQKFSVGPHSKTESSQNRTKLESDKLGFHKSVGLPSVHALQEKFSSSKSDKEHKDSVKTTSHPVARPRSGLMKTGPNSHANESGDSNLDVKLRTTDHNPKPAPRKSMVESGVKKTCPERPKSPLHKKSFSTDVHSKSSSELNTRRSASSQSPSPRPTSPPPPLPNSPPPPLPSSNPVGEVKHKSKSDNDHPSHHVATDSKGHTSTTSSKTTNSTGISDKTFNSGYIEAKSRLKTVPEHTQIGADEKVISHAPVKSKVLADTSVATNTTYKGVDRRHSEPVADQPLAMYVVPTEKKKEKVLSGLLASLAGVRNRSASTPSVEPPKQFTSSSVPSTTSSSSVPLASSTSTSTKTSSLFYINSSKTGQSLSTTTVTSRTSTPSISKTSTTFFTPSVTTATTSILTPAVRNSSAVAKTSAPPTVASSNEANSAHKASVSSISSSSSSLITKDKIPVAPVRKKSIEAKSSVSSKMEDKTAKSSQPEPEVLNILHNLKHVSDPALSSSSANKTSGASKPSEEGTKIFDVKHVQPKGILKKEGLNSVNTKKDDANKEIREPKKIVEKIETTKDIAVHRTEKKVDNVDTKLWELKGQEKTTQDHPIPPKRTHHSTTGDKSLLSSKTKGLSGSQEKLLQSGGKDSLSHFSEVKLKRVMPEKKDMKNEPLNPVFDVKLHKADEQKTPLNAKEIPKTVNSSENELESRSSRSKSKTANALAHGLAAKSRDNSSDTSKHVSESSWKSSMENVGEVKKKVQNEAQSNTALGKKKDHVEKSNSSDIPQWKKDIEERRKKLREEIAKSEADVPSPYRRAQERQKDRPKSADILSLWKQERLEGQIDVKNISDLKDGRTERPKSMNILDSTKVEEKLNWQLEAERRMAAQVGFDNEDEAREAKETAKPKEEVIVTKSPRNIPKSSSSQENVTDNQECISKSDENEPTAKVLSEKSTGEEIKNKKDALRSGDGKIKKTEDFREKLLHLKHVDVDEEPSVETNQEPKDSEEDQAATKSKVDLTKPHKLLNANNNMIHENGSAAMNDGDHISMLLKKNSPIKENNKQEKPVHHTDEEHLSKKNEEKAAPHPPKRRITVIGKNHKGVIESPPQTPVTRKKIEVGKVFDFERSLEESTTSTDTESSLVLSTAQLTIEDSVHTPPSRPPPPSKRILTSPGHISAIELQQQLMEIDNRLTDLELRGRDLEDSIRNVNTNEDDDDELMIEWFKLISEKNDLVRKEADLVYISREQELEGEQDQIEHQLRYLLCLPDGAKSPEEQQEEDYLIQRKIDLVDQRDCIVNSMDEDRIRYMEEDRDIEVMLKDKGLWMDTTGALAAEKALKGKKVAKSKFYV